MTKRITIMLLALLCFCGCGQAKVKHYTVKVVAEYPHDVTSYTQGLFFQDGTLYESAGQYRESRFRTVDLATGTDAQPPVRFAAKYFAEGAVILGGNLYILTWTNKVAFIYDAQTLEYKQTYSYPREGWGLTTDGKSLIASDGSSKIYFLSPELQQQRFITVRLDGRPVRLINELEWIDGKIWANVYTTDSILIINPSDGTVEGVIDCSGLLPESLRTPDTDVLNGIAISPDGRIYLTGKYWPRLYEVQLVEQK